MKHPHIPYQECNITWQNIAITIRYTPQWSKFAEMAHLEIERVGDGQLPITSTGYKSHFTPKENIEEYGSVQEFVRAWLDEYSKKKEWKTYLVSQRQLTLI